MKPTLPIVIISGPTATFKSKTAIHLGMFLQKNGIPSTIVNFDSLLFYRELNIGTAKPTKEEQSQVLHTMIDISSITQPLNAADYCREACQVITDCHNQKIVPILTGGSGFYLRACIKGMYPSLTPSDEVKSQVQQMYHTSGISAIIQELQRHDPISVQRLHPNDHYRLLRALEHFYSTRTPFSANLQAIPFPFDFSTPQNPEWSIFHCYLDLDKISHWHLIQERTHRMLANGLISEVDDLMAQGFKGNEKPLQSIGYKETLDFLTAKGEKDSEALAEKISLATRQLAKAQRTFFQKITPKHPYHPTRNSEKLLDDVLRFLTYSKSHKSQ